MEHQFFAHQHFTVEMLQEILDAGRLSDWVPLIMVIEANPFGPVSERTLKLCELNLCGSPVFKRVIWAARQAALKGEGWYVGVDL
jgi:hypothetical protein